MMLRNECFNWQVPVFEKYKISWINHLTCLKYLLHNSLINYVVPWWPSNLRWYLPLARRDRVCLEQCINAFHLEGVWKTNLWGCIRLQNVRSTLTWWTYWLCQPKLSQQEKKILSNDLSLFDLLIFQHKKM